MKTIIAGNWKMNLTNDEVNDYLNSLNKIKINNDKEVKLFVPSIYLASAKALNTNNNVSIGCQNMHQEMQGAFTGEISAPMLNSINIDEVLIGHSERREYFNESDVLVNKKVLQALANNIKPTICVGETLEERQGNLTNNVLECQLKEALKDVDPESLTTVTIAYEPLWAIGTGETATSEQAQEACSFIRQVLGKVYGDEIANNVAILYGGSVNNDNFNEIIEQADINGVLVGGASLKIDTFSEMMK